MCTLKRLFIFLLFWFSIGRLLAQNDLVDSLRVPCNLKIAYNGSIIYPGLLLGGEYPIKQMDITKYRCKRDPRHYSQKRFLDIELAFYHHPTFHDNYYLLAGWLMRKQRPRGFFSEWSPAIGYSHTFLNEETYLVDEFGNITLRKLAGYNYIMAAISGGCGYKFNPTTSIYFRSSLLIMFPSNNFAYLRPAINLGVIWQTKHLWESAVKVTKHTKGRQS